MVKKPNIQKAILKILAEKPAVSMQSIMENQNPKTSYALTRSMKNLVEAGCAELHKSDNKNYFKITKKGKTKLNTIRLEGEDALVSTSWDGFWRIILLDLPENRKPERESLRYLLKKAGFVCLKNSAWISPFPFEHLFTNIKKDLGLTTEMMIIVTEFIDEESKKVLFKTFGK
jgi:DNA-binding transcriptional regulator PaaX